MSTTPLVSSTEVARRLHASRATVTRLAREGILPPAQQLAGRRGAYLFDAAEVDRFAETYRNPRAKTRAAS